MQFSSILQMKKSQHFTLKKFHGISKAYTKDYVVYDVYQLPT